MSIRGKGWSCTASDTNMAGMVDSMTGHTCILRQEKCMEALRALSKEVAATGVDIPQFADFCMATLVRDGTARVRARASGVDIRWGHQMALL